MMIVATRALLLMLAATTASAGTFNWTFQDRYVAAGTPSQGGTIRAPDFSPFTASIGAGGGVHSAFATQSSSLGATHLYYSGNTRGGSWASVGRSYLHVQFTIANTTAWGLYGSLSAWTGGGGPRLVLRPLEGGSDLVNVQTSAPLNYSGTMPPGTYELEVFEEAFPGQSACSFDFQIPEPSTLSLLASAAVAALSARRR